MQLLSILALLISGVAVLIFASRKRRAVAALSLRTASRIEELLILCADVPTERYSPGRDNG